MTRKELVKDMALRANLTQKDCLTALNAFVETVSDTITNGGTIHISQFGTFGAKERAERVGFNLSTRERLVIPPCYAPYFKFSPVIKNEVKKLEVED